MSTLIEKLRDIERMRPGSEWPEWLKEPNGWGGPLSALCKEAADVIEALDSALSAAQHIKIEGHMYDGTMVLSVSHEHARSKP